GRVVLVVVGPRLACGRLKSVYAKQRKNDQHFLQEPLSIGAIRLGQGRWGWSRGVVDLPLIRLLGKVDQARLEIAHMSLVQSLVAAAEGNESRPEILAASNMLSQAFSQNVSFADV